MRRGRIESLEERKMFSVTDLIVDPFNTNSALSTPMAEPPGIVDFIDPDQISTPATVDSRPELPNRITATYSGDVGLAVVAGNRIGVDLARASSWATTPGSCRRAAPITIWLPGTYGIASSNHIPMEELSLNLTTGLATNDGGELVGGSNLIIVVCSRAPGDNVLLPYIEGDNVYKSGKGLHDIVDGSSNTLMFGDAMSSVSPINVDLLGLVDTSPIELSVISLDTWEHAYSAGGITTAFPDVFKHADTPERGRAANGILIGLLVPEAIGTPTGSVTFALAVDPSNPNVVYVGSNSFLTTDPQGPTYAPLRVDTTGMADVRSALVRSNEYRSNIAASLLASAEYFSRFANTTFDDEAALSVLLGNGDGTFRVTHDAEFEKLASESRSDRSQYVVRMEDVLISGILHEDNEFSFPRMIREGAAAIMAEWTSGLD